MAPQITPEKSSAHTSNLASETGQTPKIGDAAFVTTEAAGTTTNDPRENWQTATGKRAFSSPSSPAFSDASPPHANIFKKLAMVDEIDVKLANTSKPMTSSQKKKRKKGGRRSPRFT